jgi:hypothetical protein
LSRRKFPSSYKSLLHFDFPYVGEPNSGLRDEIGIEGWSAQGNTKFVGTELPNDGVVAGTPWYGYRCLQTTAATDYLSCTNVTGMWNLSSEGSYEVEMFARPTTATAGNILVVGDMTLGLNASLQLTLTSTTLGLSITSTGTLTLNAFNHIVLRFAGGTAYLFIGGQASGSQAMTASASLSPTEARLGGFSGQLDEFRFRHSVSTGNPVVPTQPYTGYLDLASINGRGNGKHGDVSLVGGTNININSYAMIQGIAGAGLNVTIGQELVGQYGEFEEGDEIMILHSLKRNDTGNYESDLGKYELRNVVSRNGTTLVINKPITDFNVDPGTYYTQAIKVPNFKTFQLALGVTLKCPDFDTVRGGGIIAFKSQGDVTLYGKLLSATTGPKRTDSLRLTHADMIDNFVLTGNVFIVSGGTIGTGADCRIGGDFDGSGKGGKAAKGRLASTDNPSTWGYDGAVGVGGAGVGGSATGSDPTYRAVAGKPGFGGGGGGVPASGETEYTGHQGKSAPNVIIIGKIVAVPDSAIATGGGGGGGAGMATSGSGNGGGGYAGKGSSGGFDHQPTATSNAGQRVGGDGAYMDGEGIATNWAYYNGAYLYQVGGLPGGCGYGGGSGGPSGNSGYSGAGSGTGFCYIAVAA